MLPACNRGAGMNMGFPDPCLTPAAPAPIMVPYPNIGMNTMAAPFSPNVKVSFMPALNMGSKIVMTSGDEGGSVHPTFKGSGAYTTGNPIVYVNYLPAENLTCMTTGNNMNNPVGMVAVPSATNVFYTWQGGSIGQRLGLEDMVRLGQAVHNHQETNAVTFKMLDHRIGYIKIERMISHLSTTIFNAIRQLEQDDVQTLVIDLRNNPGGDSVAALSLAGDFLPQGTILAYRIDSDGDEVPIRSRQDDPYTLPLVILVNRRTASASELFAGALQAHQRAIVLGERTYGKGSAQRVVAGEDGSAVYATVAEYKLADGRRLEGDGLLPDVVVPNQG